jgi:hypothetical protein
MRDDIGDVDADEDDQQKLQKPAEGISGVGAHIRVLSRRT